MFNTNNISAVVVDGFSHGANYDNLALDVAKSYGVSGYVIENHMMRYVKDKIVLVRSVLDYNLNKRIPLEICKLGLKSVDINNYLFYLDKMSAFLEKKRKSIKDIVKSFLPPYTSELMHMLVSVSYTHLTLPTILLV